MPHHQQSSSGLPNSLFDAPPCAPKRLDKLTRHSVRLNEHRFDPSALKESILNAIRMLSEARLGVLETQHPNEPSIADVAGQLAGGPPQETAGKLLGEIKARLKALQKKAIDASSLPQVRAALIADGSQNSVNEHYPSLCDFALATARTLHGQQFKQELDKISLKYSGHNAHSPKSRSFSKDVQRAIKYFRIGSVIRIGEDTHELYPPRAPIWQHVVELEGTLNQAFPNRKQRLHALETVREELEKTNDRFLRDYDETFLRAHKTDRERIGWKRNDARAQGTATGTDPALLSSHLLDTVFYRRWLHAASHVLDALDEHGAVMVNPKIRPHPAETKPQRPSLVTAPTSRITCFEKGGLGVAQRAPHVETSEQGRLL